MFCHFCLPEQLPILILLAQIGIGERWSLVGLFNTFAQIFWLPALFFIPLALLLRSRRTLVLLLPAVLAFLITFGDHFVPHASLTPTADQTSFTLMTFNLFDDGRDSTSTVTLIEDADADVVAMQELNPRTAAALEEHFATTYPYRALHSDKGQFRGLGVMSKFPLSDDRYWDYDWMSVSLGHQSVRIDMNGQTLTLYNLHPTHPGMQGRFFDATLRGQEIDALLKEARQEAPPFMMVGDFNMPELSDDYAHIVHDYGFVDAYRVRGWGLGHTFTHGVVPFLRLDYMFLGEAVNIAEINVGPTSAGSDHRPLWAALVLQEQ